MPARLKGAPAPLKDSVGEELGMSAGVYGALMQPRWLMDGHNPPKRLCWAIAARQVGETDEGHGFGAPAAVGVGRTRSNKYRKQRQCKCFRHVFLPRAYAERRAIELREIKRGLAVATTVWRTRNTHRAGALC